MNVDSTLGSTEIHWNDQTTFICVFFLKRLPLLHYIFKLFLSLDTVYCVDLFQKGNGQKGL